jgi:tetratricopeptide (TPR) repeat protein
VKRRRRMRRFLVGLAVCFLVCSVAEAQDVVFELRIPSEVNMEAFKRIAVVEIRNDEGNRIGNVLGAQLQQTGVFDILERERLNLLLEEHNLSVSGLVDESSAGEIGKILGVDALIYGAVSIEKTKKGKFADLTLKVVSVESALIIAQVSKRSKAKNVAKLVPGFVQHIAPHSKRVKAPWDGNCKCERAYRLVKASMFDEAKALLDERLGLQMENVKKRQKDKGKDRSLASTYYNLGLIAEAMEDIEGAAEMYESALRARIDDPSEKIKKANKRAHANVDAWHRYRNQDMK